MNSEKIRQLTETLHQTVEALNECYSSGNGQQATHATCNTFGSMPNGGYGPNPMSFGWSPSRVGPYPVFNGAFPGGTYPQFSGAPAQGWSGGFSNPWWGMSGPMQANGYAPVQTFGGTPAYNVGTHPFHGMNTPSNFAAGFYGSNVTNCVPGWGMPMFGNSSPFQGGFPTGTWGSTTPGSFPVYGANGSGFPFFGYGQPGFADGPCAPQNQPTGWTPNCGPTGVVDIPLAA